MKAIDLSTNSATLAEILDLAGEDNVILKTRDGRQFVLAEIDDFEAEVRGVRRNKALMQFLRERSADKSKLTLTEVRERLRGSKKHPRGPAVKKRER